MAATFYKFDETKTSIAALPEEAWMHYGAAELVAEHVQDYWEGVAWLNRCIDIRAKGVVRVPFAIHGKTGDIVWESDSNEDLPAQLAWLAGLPTLLSLTESALCLVGSAYWLREANRVRVLNLRWLAPQTVTPIWDEKAGLVRFERRLSTIKIDLRPDEVVYFSLPHPLHETAPGPAPIQAALRAAGVLYSVDGFAATFFERGAIKATLLTVEGNPPKAEMDKLESWWKRFFQGEKSAHNTAAVRAGVTPQVIGEGLEGLSNQTLTQEKREDIATALGVPHSLVMSNAANYATAQQDESNFLNWTILPECRLIEQAINDQLLRPLGYQMHFQPETMDAFQEDETQRAGALVQLRQAGMPMVTALAVLGYEIPEGLPIEEEERAAEQINQEMQTEPEDEAAQVEESGEEGNQAETMKVADLGRWQRKALKALKAGRSPSVPFRSEWIDEDTADGIVHILSHAQTTEEVKSAFELAPFLGLDHKGGYP